MARAVWHTRKFEDPIFKSIFEVMTQCKLGEYTIWWPVTSAHSGAFRPDGAVRKKMATIA